MEIEERLDELETIARDELAASLALTCLIRAFITTHPAPTALKRAFVGFLEDCELRVSENGFEKGRAEKVPQGVITEIRRHAKSLLAFFP